MLLLIAPSFGVPCVVRVASDTNFNERVKKSEREPAKPLNQIFNDFFFFRDFFFLFPINKVWHDKQVHKETKEREESKDHKSDGSLS